MTVKAFLKSKPFLSALKGARKGGWHPMVFALGDKSAALPSGVALIHFEGKEKLDHELGHGDTLNAIRHGLMTSEGKFKSAVLLAEAWMGSTIKRNANPEDVIRPRDDPKRRSAVMVSVYTINRAGKFVDVPADAAVYPLIGEKQITTKGMVFEDVRLHPAKGASIGA